MLQIIAPSINVSLQNVKHGEEIKKKEESSMKLKSELDDKVSSHKSRIEESTSESIDPSSLAYFMKHRLRKQDSVKESVPETSSTYITEYEEWQPENEEKISSDTRTSLHEKLGY
jgi:hypothetical protein